MIARWLRRMLLLESLAYAGLILWLGPAGGEERLWALAIGVPALILLARALWLLNIHAFASYYSEPPPAEFAGAGPALRAYFGELFAMSVLFAGVQLAPRWFCRPEAARDGAPLNLLVHGFGCNGAVWWPLRRWLARQGLDNLHCVTLEPMLTDLDRHVERLEAFGADLAQRCPRSPLRLVGHSMGGIVARRWLQRSPLAKRVELLITLGSPHAGTALARYHPAPNAVQMRPGSAWLRALNAAPDPCPVISVISHHDQVVVPQSSAVCPASRVVPIAGCGHLAMMFDGRIRRLLLGELGKSANIAGKRDAQEPPAG